MRIFYIGCLTLLGVVMCFTQLNIFNGGVVVEQIVAPTLPTFIWNIITLLVGVITGTVLMGNLVEGYYEYYDLYGQQKKVLIDARDRIKKLEDKFIALGLERDELKIEKTTHSKKLQRLEDVQDMIRAIENQYGGRSQTTVDLSQYKKIKSELWKEVFYYGK